MLEPGPTRWHVCRVYCGISPGLAEVSPLPSAQVGTSHCPAQRQTWHLLARCGLAAAAIPLVAQAVVTSFVVQGHASLLEVCELAGAGALAGGVGGDLVTAGESVHCPRRCAGFNARRCGTRIFRLPQKIWFTNDNHSRSRVKRKLEYLAKKCKRPQTSSAQSLSRAREDIYPIKFSLIISASQC